MSGGVAPAPFFQAGLRSSDGAEKGKIHHAVPSGKHPGAFRTLSGKQRGDAAELQRDDGNRQRGHHQRTCLTEFGRHGNRPFRLSGGAAHRQAGGGPH